MRVASLMVLLSCACVLGSVRASKVEAVAIPVRYSRASRLLDRMKAYGLVLNDVGATHLAPTGRGLLESLGDSVFVDDLKGVIIVDGAPEQIAQAKSVIAQFDVRPRKIALHVVVDSKIDKVRYTVDGQSFNNSIWTTSNSETGLKLSFTCRVNNDNTVTIFSVIGHDNVIQQKSAFRLKNGKSITLPEVAESGQQVPRIDVRATIED